MKNVFRILAVILLGLSVASCELFSPSYWSRVNKRLEERGEKCYKNQYGNIFCEYREGNRTY